ncbi:hypothetical protein F5Y19DRAFT_32190 [Xylariaceae sp. FL1651]|nr:hypothetical protein F5Y19DRAFT_32190 [Xylariaceae sp. FL1651]
MARLPRNLVANFTQELRLFQASRTAFRVLCSLPSSSAATAPSTRVEPPRRPPKYILVLDASFNPPTLAHQRMALSALSDPRYKTKEPLAIEPEGSGGPSETTSPLRVLLLLAINNADKAAKPAAFPQRLAMMYVFAQDLLAASAQHRALENGNETAGNALAACEAVDIAVTTEPYFHAKSGAIATSDFYKGVDVLDEPASAVSTDNATESEQIYLTGYDTLIRIFNPKYYPDNSMKRSLDPFFAHSRLRVTMRTDDDWGDAAQQISYLDELRDGKLEAAGGRAEWVDRVEMVQGRKDDEEIISSTKVRNAVRRQDWEALKSLVSEDVVAWIRDHDLYSGDDE